METTYAMRMLRTMAACFVFGGLLAGCGGAAQTSTNDQPQLLAASNSSPPTTGDWTFCANENGACVYTGTQNVRYGAGSTWVTKSIAWGTACNNATFGDPAPGAAKHCEVSSTWAFCANENGQCSFADTRTVRYGGGTTYVTQTLTGGAACTNNMFGDPISGTAKHCDTAGTTWTQCASEGGTCSFTGTKPVMYGANGNFLVKNLTGGAACNNTTFGDPAPGAAKKCYVPGAAVGSGGGTTTTTKTSTSTTQNCSAGCTWNTFTTFNMVNGTRGAYPDSQVYWAIIGKDWNTGKFVHVDSAGKLVPMAMADNGKLTKNGVNYTNYFYTMAQLKSVTIPPINSARMMLSVGGPMYIQVNTDVNGNIGYAGANIENPADPNLNVTFDFIEMAIVPTSGFYGNTTRVDQFGFPVTLRLQGLGGYDQTVGETETRASLISQYIAAVPNEFKGLAQAPYAPYRIMAPAHASFNAGGANANYLDAYINAIWNKYTTQTLTFTDQQGTFSGKVVNGKFQFTDGQGTYYIHSKPTTAMALLGSGSLADATGATPGPVYDKQLQIQAQMCAAINRHIVEDPAHWSDSNFYYPAGQPANYFAKFFHDHSINKLAYGFAYDDVWNYSSSVHTTAPTTATVTVGW